MAAVEDTSINKNGNEEPLSALEQKVVKQMEYYFGDKNFPKDKFLRQKAEEDDGWVTFECLQTFSRLKAMAVENGAIADAIKKSKSSLVEVSEDNSKIRRLESVPLPENTVEARQISKAKTVYCKGFPKETTLDELEEFFGDHGKVIYVMMRRIYQSKEFKGSVFVEFSTLEEAKKIMAIEKLMYKDEELIKMFREEYYTKKDKERTELKDEERSRKRKAHEQAKEEKEEITFPSGSVLHFKGVGEQTSREDLKELFGAHEDIDWVDFNREDTEGYIRFAKEGAAQRAVDAVKAANDGKICIRDVETEVKVLEGEEETKYFEKAKEEMHQKRQKKADKHGSRGRGGGRGGGRGRGRGGGRGRGRGRGRGGYSTREKRPREGNDDVKTEKAEGGVVKTEKAEEKKSTHTHFDDEPPAAKQSKTEN